MPIDLSKLTATITQVEGTEASAIALLNTLFAEVQANINDPAALQALVDRGNASVTALAAAVAADTATPATPAAPQ